MSAIKFFQGWNDSQRIFFAVIDDGCDWVKYFYKEDGEVKSDWQNKRILLDISIQVAKEYIEHRQPELVEVAEGYLNQKKAA